MIFAVMPNERSARVRMNARRTRERTTKPQFFVRDLSFFRFLFFLSSFSAVRARALGGLSNADRGGWEGFCNMEIFSAVRLILI